MVPGPLKTVSVGFHMGQELLWEDKENFVEGLGKAPVEDTHLDTQVVVDYSLGMEPSHFLREVVAYHTADLIVVDKEVDWC